MAWDVRAWQERLERLSSHSVDAWSPAIDVYETADAFIVAAEVPGVTRDQIELAVEESRLTIRGHRTDAHATSGRHFHQVERGFGSFVRTFQFGEKLDAARVTAELKEGVLMISLPKVPAPPARHIAVK